MKRAKLLRIVPSSEVEPKDCSLCNVPGVGLWRHYILKTPPGEAAFWGASEAVHKAHHRFEDEDTGESAEAFVQSYIRLWTLAPRWARDMAQEQLRLVTNMLRESLFGPDGPYPGQEQRILRAAGFDVPPGAEA